MSSIDCGVFTTIFQYKNIIVNGIITIKNFTILSNGANKLWNSVKIFVSIVKDQALKVNA